MPTISNTTLVNLTFASAETHASYVVESSVSLDGVDAVLLQEGAFDVNSANQTEDLVEWLLSSTNASASDLPNGTDYWYTEDGILQKRGTPPWLFAPVLLVAFIFACILSSFILTYYRKMMFAEFALAAIHWRNGDSAKAPLWTSSSFGSFSSFDSISPASSYLSVFSIFPGSVVVDVEKPPDYDEDALDTYTTTSSHWTEPDGDDSGYGFFLQAAVETRELPVFETVMEGISDSHQEIVLEAVPVSLLYGRAVKHNRRLGTVEAFGLHVR